MKTIKFLSLTVLATVFLLGTSCGKYEEGPAFSLRTKKARLAGEWKADKYVSPAGEISDISNEENGTMEFTKDGGLTYTMGGFSMNGTWEFVDSKEYLRLNMTFFGQSSSSEEKIVKLKNDELWLESEDGSRMYYVPA